MTSPPRSRAADRRYYGVYVGVVAAVNDPAKQGRVQLRLPWFDANFVTSWCRVCYFYAGSGYGSFFVPELDTEVAVSFLHGDMRFPLVLGGLYSNDVLPATYRADDKDEKMIRTRGGHQVVLDDTPGAEKITLLDSSGTQRVELNTQDNSLSVSSDGGTVTVRASGGKVVIQAGDIDVQADQSLTLKANGPVTIKGSTIDLN